MNDKLQNFYDQQTTPWMQLFYRLIYAQLPSDLTGKKVLDFGAGFGWTANHLASLGADVLAIEPNAEMVENRMREQSYEMHLGGLAELSNLTEASFDVIICHNVLEYAADERLEIMAEFDRLLKTDGFISIVKHNFAGSVLQRIVFENHLDEVLGMLGGTVKHNAQSFGAIEIYELADMLKNLLLRIDKTYGVAAFNRLQPNEYKFTDGWLDKMFELEMACSERSEFRDIAFFHHVLLRKSND
ncbi:MAG: methyltransferase domain-containing protein [Streptococcaceae bacterium]|nr:methyltransferase domain-containing protein [Streptococcaceae bacterium]